MYVAGRIPKNMQENLGDEGVRMKEHVQTHAPEVLAAILDSSYVGKHTSPYNEPENLGTVQLGGLQDCDLSVEEQQRGKYQYSEYSTEISRENYPNVLDSAYRNVDENFDRQDMGVDFNVEKSLSSGIKGLNFCEEQEFEEGDENLCDSLELSSGTLKAVLENGGNDEKTWTKPDPCCSTPVGEIGLHRGRFYNEAGIEEEEIKTRGNVLNTSKHEKIISKHNLGKEKLDVDRGKEIQSNNMKSKTPVQKNALDKMNSQRGLSKLDVENSKHGQNISNVSNFKTVSEKGSVTSCKSLPKKTDIIERNINKVSERVKKKSYRDIHLPKNTPKADQKTKSTDSVEDSMLKLNGPPENNASEQDFIHSDVKSVDSFGQQGNFYPSSYGDMQHLHYGHGNFVPPYVHDIVRTTGNTNHYGYPYGHVYASNLDQYPHSLDSSYGSSGWYNNSYALRDLSLVQPGVLHTSTINYNYTSPQAIPEFSSHVTQSAPPKTNYYSRPPLMEQVDFENSSEHGTLSSSLPFKEFLDNQPVGGKSNGLRIHKQFVSDPQLSKTNPLPPISGYLLAGNEGYGSPKKQISYKPYTLKEFKSLKPVKLSGGLGPNKRTNSDIHKVDIMVSKQKEYAELLRAQHAVQKQKWEKKGNKATAKEENIQQAKTKRQAALEYAKAVPKPQSASKKRRPPSEEATQKEENKQVNDEREVTLLEILKMRHEKEKSQVDALRKDLKAKLR